MTTYHIRGQNGNDGNNGSSFDKAYKTWDGLVAAVTLASGDTVKVYEQIRSNSATGITNGWATTGAAANISISGLSFVTIEWDGQGEQAELRGDQVLVNAGWTADSNAYWIDLTNGPAAAPDFVVFGWDQNIDTDGHHYGHLKSDTVANCKAGTGANGLYNYNTATKRFYVYLGGANPNGHAKKVSVGWIPTTNFGSLLVSTGTRNTIRNVNAALFYTSSGQTGWFVELLGTTNNRVINCVSRDNGLHTFGAYSSSGFNASGNIFVNCRAEGCRVDGGYFIFYTSDSTTITGQRSGCVVHAYRIKGLDGNALTGLGSMSQTLFYAHADAGTLVTDITDSRCTVQYFETNAATVSAFLAANQVAPSDRTDWTTYSYKVIDPTVIDAGQEMVTTDLALIRPRWKQTRALAEGAGQKGGLNLGWDGGSTDRSLYIESGEFIVNLDDTAAGANTTRFFYVAVAGGTAFIHAVNTSVLNVGTQATSGSHTFVDYDGANANYYRFYGGVFAHKTAATGNGLCGNDGTTTAANHTFVDCAGHNIGATTYSANSSLNATAEWTAAKTDWVVLPSAPFLNSTRLSIEGGSLTGYFRATSTNIPDSDINGGGYRGLRGCYQSVFTR